MTTPPPEPPTGPTDPPGSPYGSPPFPTGQPGQPGPQQPAPSYPPQQGYPGQPAQGGYPSYASYPAGPPQPYQYGAPKPPSKALAWWALGLSLAFFCWPITTLVSIGLAVAVLSRSRDGQDRGRGLAIAALVIDALALLVAAALVVLVVATDAGDGGSAERDPDGQVTSPQQASVFEVREGDCVNDDNIFGDDTATVTTDVEVVPCTGAHQLEAYLVTEVADGDFPGTGSVRATAQQRCGDAFAGFVGRTYDRSTLGVYYYVPTQQTWEQASDRAITCLVGDPGVETTGTLQGADR